MAIPQGVALAIKYGPAVAGILGSIFGKKKKPKLDPRIVEQLIAQTNRDNLNQQRDTGRRLRSRGLKPGDAAYDSALGVVKRRRGPAMGQLNRTIAAQQAGLQRQQQIFDQNDGSLGEAIGALGSNILTDLQKPGTIGEDNLSASADIPGIRNPSSMPNQLQEIAQHALPTPQDDGAMNFIGLPKQPRSQSYPLTRKASYWPNEVSMRGATNFIRSPHPQIGLPNQLAPMRRQSTIFSYPNRRY